MLSHDVTELQPQVVLALALERAEGIVVDNVAQLPRSFTPALLDTQVCDVLLPVTGLQPAGRAGFRFEFDTSMFAWVCNACGFEFDTRVFEQLRNVFTPLLSIQQQGCI